MNDIAQTSTAEEARARADRIRSGMKLLAEWQQDVIDAYAARDWEAMGYGSWDAYLSGEYGEHRVRLPRKQRREMVAAMRGAGMTQPAIAAATGVPQQTVSRDLESTQMGTVKITGVDGKDYTRPTPEAEEVVDAEIVDEPAAPTYSAPPTPERAPDRQPRVDVSRAILVALTELRQTRESLEALTRAQLARQDEETRRIWAARLNTELEALTDFHNSLIKENNQ